MGERYRKIFLFSRFKLLQSKQSIIDYIKNIPPEHQADVAMLLARQANNSQNDLITKVAQKQVVKIHAMGEKKVVLFSVFIYFLCFLII